jgi:hypothetical protein
MNYEFYPWMFREGNKSKCYLNRGSTLSEGDRAGLQDAYPSTPFAIVKLLQERTDAITLILQAEGMDSSLRKSYTQRKNSLTRMKENYEKQIQHAE